jgi:hypothetical protein
MVLLKRMSGNADELQWRSSRVAGLPLVRIAIRGRPVRRHEVVEVLVTVNSPTIV